MFRARKHKVLVIYRSGAKVKIKCDKFKVTTSITNGISGIEWENPSPRPLRIGVSEIAAVYQLY